MYEILPQPQPSRTPVLLAVAISGLVFLTLGFFLGRNFPLKQPIITPTPVSVAISTPTPDIAKNWKTYTSSDGKFSFKYPPELMVVINKFGKDSFGKDYILSLRLYTSDYKEEGNEMEAEVTKGYYYDLAWESNRCNAVDTQHGLLVTNSSLSGFETQLVRSVLDSAGENSMALINYNNSCLTLGGDKASPLKTTWYKQFDQILSTLKFLDQELTPYSCTPKFVVETGPELTASEVYSQACYRVTSQKECEKVDVYLQKTQNFGNADGIPDCQWLGQATD